LTQTQPVNILWGKIKFLDMEVLFTKCKRTHSMRLVQNSNAVKKIITLEDLESAFENFMLDR
jgi:hypothetical protein